MSVSPYYERDGVRLFLGDCRDVLPTLDKRSASAVVTDPPYGINTKSDGNGKLSPWADLCNASLWYAAWITACRRLLSEDGGLWSCLNWRSIVTFQKAACDTQWPMESLLVWDKQWIGPGGNKGLRPSYELVALWAMPEFSIADRGVPDVQRFQWSSHKPNNHPAEKPVALMEFCIVHSSACDATILDPFMGSGSTGEACIRLGRRFIGIEIEERWCEHAAKRLDRILSEPRLPFVEERPEVQTGLWDE